MARIKRPRAPPPEDVDDADDWEAEVNMDTAPTVVPAGMANADGEDVHDGGALEITVEPVMDDAVAAVDGSRPPRRRRVTRKEQIASILAHRVHLMCLLARGRVCSQACDAEPLQSLALSAVPADLHAAPEGGACPSTAALESLFHWFRLVLDTDASLEIVRDAVALQAPSVRDRPPPADPRRTLHGPHECQLAVWVALLRGLGIATRWVKCLRPMPASPHAAQMASGQSPGKASKAKMSGQEPLGPGAAEDWAEVACRAPGAGPETGASWRWVHCDPRHGLLDLPSEYERASAARSRTGAVSGRFAYVCAFTPDAVTDVTRRYTLNMALATAQRPADEAEWWHRTLREASPAGMGALEEAEAVDASEFAALDASEKPPTTIKGLRETRAFVLDRDLTKSKLLRPGAQALPFLVRGRHLVYRAEDVAEGKTMETWYRVGRQVKLDEVDKPATWKGGGGGDGDKDDDDGPAGDGAAPEMCTSQLVYAAWFTSGSSSAALDVAVASGAAKPPAAGKASTKRPVYGTWQTEPLRVPPVEDGVVPRNCRGHVDAFTPTHLPAGAVHLRLPGVAKVAKRLGVDYAPAVVGFDWGGGQCTPRFEGVVVPEEAADLLSEAHAAVEHESLELAVRRRREEALCAWKDFLRALFSEAKLRAHYAGAREGGDGDDAGAAGWASAEGQEFI